MAARSEDLRQPFLFAPNGEDAIRKAFMDMLPDRREPHEGPKDIAVHSVRRVEPQDLITILSWFTDSETQKHLSPLPKLPNDWNDKNQLAEAFVDIGNYYNNHGEPKKITPLGAINKDGDILGVVTIRWKGDPWKGDPREGEKIASVERLLVDPGIRGEGIGEKLVAEALEEIFEKRGYLEARAWVMSDEQAPGWGRIVEFFSRFGFTELLHPDRSWAEYQRRRDMNPDGRDAKWLTLKRDKWLAARKDDRKNDLPTNNLVSSNGSSL